MGRVTIEDFDRAVQRHSELVDFDGGPRAWCEAREVDEAAFREIAQTGVGLLERGADPFGAFAWAVSLGMEVERDRRDRQDLPHG